MKVILRIFCLTAVLLLSPSAPPAIGANTLAALAGNDDLNHSFDLFFEVFVLKKPIHLILVEKDTQRLLVIENDYRLKVVAAFACATGENPGQKEVRGDGRTPEGIYFITKVYKDDKITIFGDKAFHLDYPNTFDVAAGRNGDGIYIHGTNKALRPQSTRGCITLKNNDLDELVDFLNLEVTPVVIIRNLQQLRQRKFVQLAEDKFDLAKDLLLPAGVTPEQVKFDYLYIVNDGVQTVAVAEFNHRQADYSNTMGFSRGYLVYTPEKGWEIKKRVWRPDSKHILPRYPLIKAASRPTAVPEAGTSGYEKSAGLDWPGHAAAGNNADFVYRFARIFADGLANSPAGDPPGRGLSKRGNRGE